MRNQDLYLASTYAKQCNQPLEPLRVLIGDIKGGDVFTLIRHIADMLNSFWQYDNKTR